MFVIGYCMCLARNIVRLLELRYDVLSKVDYCNPRFLNRCKLFGSRVRRHNARSFVWLGSTGNIVEGIRKSTQTTRPIRNTYRFGFRLIFPATREIFLDLSDLARQERRYTHEMFVFFYFFILTLHLNNKLKKFNTNIVYYCRITLDLRRRKLTKLFNVYFLA